MEIQQSPLYRQYIKLLGWKVLACDGAAIFVKQFPFVGGLAKIQRPARLPDIAKLTKLLAPYHIRTLALEPSHHQNPPQLHAWCQSVSKHYKLNGSPYLPTKTLLVDLTPTVETIFGRFSEAKRRAVRRAQTQGIVVKETHDINELVSIKNKSAGLFGFITTFGLKQLWQVLSPAHATILLAYSTTHAATITHKSPIVGGVLLLFWQHTAYYWIAGATHKGKKLFAPTLLVWEALKRSKKQGCTQFDFVGVWDERLPKQNTSWKGFTKFKEGFGGTTCYYPLVRRPS